MARRGGDTLIVGLYEWRGGVVLTQRPRDRRYRAGDGLVVRLLHDLRVLMSGGCGGRGGTVGGARLAGSRSRTTGIL